MPVWIEIAKAGGNPPHPGLVLLPSVANPKVLRWQRPTPKATLKQYAGYDPEKKREIFKYKKIPRTFEELDQYITGLMKQAEKEVVHNLVRQATPSLHAELSAKVTPLVHKAAGEAEEAAKLRPTLEGKGTRILPHMLKGVALLVLRDRAYAIAKKYGFDSPNPFKAIEDLSEYQDRLEAEHNKLHAEWRRKRYQGTPEEHAASLKEPAPAINPDFTKISIDMRNTMPHDLTYLITGLASHVMRQETRDSPTLTGAKWIETASELLEKRLRAGLGAAHDELAVVPAIATESSVMAEVFRRIEDAQGSREKREALRSDLVEVTKWLSESLFDFKGKWFDDAIANGWTRLLWGGDHDYTTEARRLADATDKHFKQVEEAIDLAQRAGNDFAPEQRYTLNLAADMGASLRHGLPGFHWGSADEDNDVARGVAIVSGTEYRPLPDMTPSPPSEEKVVLNAWRFRRYAQRRIRETPIAAWAKLYRGMQLDVGVLERLADRQKHGRAFMPLTGATALTFDQGVAEHYAGSEWAANAASRYSAEEEALLRGVVLEVQRDEAFDRTVSFWHENKSKTYGDGTRNVQGPAFEILTGAPALEITEVTAPVADVWVSIGSSFFTVPMAPGSAIDNHILFYPFRDGTKLPEPETRDIMRTPHAIAKFLNEQYAKTYNKDTMEDLRNNVFDVDFERPVASVKDGRVVVKLGNKEYQTTGTADLRVSRPIESGSWRIKAKVVST